MDKKYTMYLLGVGLLVLVTVVVGASFAYFAVTTSKSTSTTTVTAKTPNVGTVSLKQGISNLYLNVSDSLMTEENATTNYHAVTTDDDPSTSSINSSIATISSVGGGDNINYYCKATITTTLPTSGVTNPMVNELEDGDVFIQFTSDISGITGLETAAKDLNTFTSGSWTQDNIKFTLTGNKTGNIKADVYLVNKEDKQIYLAGKSLKINININNFDCDTKAL